MMIVVEGIERAVGGGWVIGLQHIVAAGPPEVLAANPRSFTGHFLAPMLNVMPEQVPAPAPGPKPRGRKAKTAS
jgi:hypothetical protein